MTKGQDLTWSPFNGGMLMSGLSAQIAGFKNFVIKQDFRRDQSDEMTREGHGYWQLSTDELGNQPFPMKVKFALDGFTNGGFEVFSEGDNIPDGWEVEADGSTFTLDSANASAGNYCAKFACVTAADSFIRSGDFIAVNEGFNWVVSFKTKVATLGQRVKAQVEWYDSSQTALASTLSPVTLLNSTTVPTTWTTYEFTVAPPPGTYYGKLKLIAHVGGEDASTVYFDEVSVMERDGNQRKITLVALSRRENGQSALVVGTKTTLYRFDKFDGDYFSDDLDDSYFKQAEEYFDAVESYFDDPTTDQGYFESNGLFSPYFTEETGSWRIIGRNFSENGNRWEAEDISGYLVLNNGIDLPVTYQVQDSEVIPIYELRENGIASVGTIGQFNGVLMLGDVRQIKADKLADVIGHESGGDITLFQNGAVFSDNPATGRQGYALSFDGVDDVVTVAGGGSADISGSNFTFEIVFKINSGATWFPTDGGDYYLITLMEKGSLDGGTGQFSLGLIRDGNGSGTDPSPVGFPKVNATFGDFGGAYGSVRSETSLVENTWYHVAVSGSAGQPLKLYINGVFDTSGDTTPAISSNAGTDLLFGTGESSGVTPFLGGQIAEARIWNIARTQTKIRQKMFDDLTATANGLAGMWKFNEGEGSTAYDAQTNYAANNGTITGATFVNSTAPCDQYIVLPTVAVDVTASTGTDRISWTSHGMLNGDLVMLEADTMPGGLTAGRWYFVINKNTNDFQLSTRAGGSAIDIITTDGVNVTAVKSRKTFFESGMVGRTIDFYNGLRPIVVAYVGGSGGASTGGTFLKVDTDVSSLIGTSARFYVVNYIDNETRRWTNKAAVCSTADDTVTLSGHGLQDNDRVKFAGTVLPTGITAGQWYWVINSTSTTFQIATTKGGSAINMTVTNGTDVTITTSAFVSSRTAGSSVLYTNNPIPASDPGDYDRAFYVGMRIRVEGGAEDEYRTIATLPVGYALTVTEPFTYASTEGRVTAVDDRIIEASEDYFEGDMIGRRLFVEDGNSRTIESFPSFGNGLLALTDRFTFATGTFELENTNAYGEVNQAWVDRIQYRHAWGSVNAPRRFASSVTGSISRHTNILTTDYPMRSLTAGMSVIVTGAGTEGGNLTATVINVHENGRRFVLSANARTTVTESPVAAADSLNSIAGYQDLTPDSSAILKMKQLDTYFVIYKEQSQWYSIYLGSAANPFDIKSIDNGSYTPPLYRHGLVVVGKDFHIYPSRNSFYKVTPSNLKPEVVRELEMSKEEFFSRATSEVVEDVFGANNPLTKEVMWQFPSDDSVKGVCYDYQFGTVSTTGMEVSAMCAIHKPSMDPSVINRPVWFVMGDSRGRVLIYGKSDQPEEMWGGRDSIFNRLGDKYECKMRFGLLGDGANETVIHHEIIDRSSYGDQPVGTVTLNVSGFNVIGNKVADWTESFVMEAGDSLAPMDLMAGFIQDEIVVQCSNSPVRITQRIINASIRKSRGNWRLG